MDSKRSIAIGASLVAIFSLGGCITKQVKVKKKKPPIATSYATTIPSIYRQKKQRRRRPLPTSTQACVGDTCKASIIGNMATKNSFKPKKFVAIEQPPVSKSMDTPIYAPKIYSTPRKTAIQVGAFRRYAGAKVYAKRYGLLSRRYKTVIKNDMKDARPIYRVRIEGFSNVREAKQFMARYSLNGAFLVRR
jgi:hypothetical protein